MTSFDVRQGGSLRLVRLNSKNALGKLKDSQLGSGSIHGGKFSFATDLSPASVCGTKEYNIRTFVDLVFWSACKRYSWGLIGIATA